MPFAGFKGSAPAASSKTTDRSILGKAVYFQGWREADRGTCPSDRDEVIALVLIVQSEILESSWGGEPGTSVLSRLMCS